MPRKPATPMTYNDGSVLGTYSADRKTLTFQFTPEGRELYLNHPEYRRNYTPLQVFHQETCDQRQSQFCIKVEPEEVNIFGKGYLLAGPSWTLRPDGQGLASVERVYAHEGIMDVDALLGEGIVFTAVKDAPINLPTKDRDFDTLFAAVKELHNDLLNRSGGVWSPCYDDEQVAQQQGESNAYDNAADEVRYLIENFEFPS